MAALPARKGETSRHNIFGLWLRRLTGEPYEAPPVSFFGADALGIDGSAHGGVERLALSIGELLPIFVGLGLFRDAGIVALADDLIGDAADDWAIGG
jgi:hypothetical protein